MSRPKYGRPPPKPKPPPAPKRARKEPWEIVTTTTFDNDINDLSAEDQKLYLDTLQAFAKDIESIPYGSIEGANIYEIRIASSVSDKRITFNFNKREHKIIAYRAGDHRILPKGARKDAKGATRRRQPNFTEKETQLDHKCPDCGKPLWLRGYGIFCRTPNCVFRADNVLDYWLDMHEAYLK